MKNSIYFEKILCLMLLSCAFLQGRNYPAHDYGQILQKTLNPTLKHFEKDYDISVGGFGGCLGYGICKLGLHFTCSKAPNIDEARKLIVNVTQEILKAINEDKGLRPYLKEYPFETNLVNISISFEHSTKTLEGKKKIICVSMTKGEVVFREYLPIKSISCECLREDFLKSKEIIYQNY